LRRARLLFRATGDDYRAAVAATQLAMSARAVGRRRLAHAAIDWAIAVFRRTPDPGHDGWAYLALGNLLVEEIDYDSADAAYAMARAAMKRIGDVAGEANALACIGMLRDRQNRTDDAVAALGEGRDLVLSEGSETGWFDMGAIELALGRLEMRRDRLDAALTWVQTALTSVRRVGFRMVEANVLRTYAELMLRLDRPVDATAAARTAIEIANDVGWTLVRGQAEFALAQALLATGDADGARRTGDAALATLTAVDNPLRLTVTDWMAANWP
jgi:tetratricopeptide (TPR) repeat protein